MLPWSQVFRITRGRNPREHPGRRQRRRQQVAWDVTASHRRRRAVGLIGRHAADPRVIGADVPVKLAY